MNVYVMRIFYGIIDIFYRNKNVAEFRIYSNKITYVDMYYFMKVFGEIVDNELLFSRKSYVDIFGCKELHIVISDNEYIVNFNKDIITNVIEKTYEPISFNTICLNIE